jgi:metallo-beta-lactamase class B
MGNPVTPPHGFSLVGATGLILLACLGCAAHTGSTPSGASSPPPSQANELDPGLRIRLVASGAFEITHELPWPANSLLVEMADGTLVLAGTPYSPEATRHVLAWARERFGERKMVAINNGFHVDNLGGNAALLEAHVPVYGSDLTVTLLRERGEQTRQHMLEMIANPASPAHAAHTKIPYLPPDHIFPVAQGLVLKFGNEKVHVIYSGKSQAPDKVAVTFPSRALLYGGCMVLAGAQPGNTADADLTSWPDAIRTLTKLPASVVIPGHGDRLDPGLLQHTIDVLEEANSEGSGRRQ